MKNEKKMKKFIMLVIFIVKTIGSRRVISTSKIRKITEIRKKWDEKGSRGDDFGSNPHSKGEAFSRSRKVFFEIVVLIIIMAILIIIIIIPINVIIIIIYTS